MHRHTSGPLYQTRSSTTSQSRNGFPRDEEDIYHENYRMARERERGGRDDDGQIEGNGMNKPDISRKQLSQFTRSDWMDGPPPKGKGAMDETSGSPPKRLLKWPTPHLSTPVYSETNTITIQSARRIEKKMEKIETSQRPSSIKTNNSKRNTGKCDPPLVARSIDPSTIQFYRSSEKTPLLLRLSTKNKAEQTRFLPSPYQDASMEKVHLMREEEDSFASPFLPPSILYSTHVPLYLTASEQRRALIHPIKAREIRSIRLMVLPPLHFISTRTNECGGELLTSLLLISPIHPYRARRLRPVWETLVPLHANGHHVAVPFTLHLASPFTIHRIVTRVQKLQIVDARTLYRHSPVFAIEETRAVPRDSARLTTVEKEDPQMVRLIYMDHLFAARMTTRATLKVKRREVYDQEGSTYQDFPTSDLQVNTQMDKARLMNISAIKPLDSSLPFTQVDNSGRLAPPPLNQKLPLTTQSNPSVLPPSLQRFSPSQMAPPPSSGRREISHEQQGHASHPSPQSLAVDGREKEGHKREKRDTPHYNVFVRDVSAHKETRGRSHVYDQPAVKEMIPSGRHALPPSTRATLSPQEVTPPTIDKRPLDDFTIPSHPLPTFASIQSTAPIKQFSNRANKSNQAPLPLPPRPSSAETFSAEVIDPPNKIPRPRAVLPPPPPNVVSPLPLPSSSSLQPLAPKSAESLSKEQLPQPVVPQKKMSARGPVQPTEIFQRDKKAAPLPSQPPSSGPPSHSADPLLDPRVLKTGAKPRVPSTSASSTMTTMTPNATSLTPAPPSSQPPSGPPSKPGFINIIQPSSDTPQPKSAPLPLPVADGTQQSSSSGKKKKMKPPSEGSSSGGKKHKLVNNGVAKKDKPKANRKEKRSGSNKKSKFGPRAHEQMEELGNVRLVAEAVKAGEIEADPNAQDAITRLIKKATTPLGGKKKKKKKSSK
ncbi:hypothetical protein PENTCL1PPCAC_11580 [Pristionchus entomophagus]|uniref:WH2 domain-containing protein n=1 Tax=Pristionchus entomophagus TaxID=358040 RepID=A0AAV5T1Q8_9BILA|nr:hypothetical protein PENTCL1PPCAC_11580 [Pristionchus entomophagus]